MASPDITTPEGLLAVKEIIRREEFDRFCDLMGQFISMIRDDKTREFLQDALNLMEIVNAE